MILLLPLLASAQSTTSASPPPPKPKTPHIIGACFVPVPDVIYSQVPALPRGKGLVVENVAKESVANRIGLRQYDILYRFDKNSIQDSKQLAGLLWATPPGDKCNLYVMRAGKPVTISFTHEEGDLPEIPKSYIKPSGPPAVNLRAEALSDDRLKVTFTYYAGGLAKLETIVCEGSVDDIQKQVKQVYAERQVPARVQELLDVAVQRIRTLKKQ